MVKIKFAFTVPNNFDALETVAYKSFLSCKSKLEKKYDIYYIVAQDANVCRARNYCVNSGKSNLLYQNDFDYDYLLFVDYDIEFTADDVERLLLSGKDIISGIYFRADGKPEYSTDDHCRKEEDITEITACGAGFLLVKKNIFESVTYPWFCMAKRQLNDGKVQLISEDHYFIENARSLGYSAYIHNRCVVNHYKKDRMMNNQQQLKLADIEKMINRSLTQIASGVQLIVDELEKLSTQNRELMQQVKQTTEQKVKE